MKDKVKDKLKNREARRSIEPYATVTIEGGFKKGTDNAGFQPRGKVKGNKGGSDGGSPKTGDKTGGKNGDGANLPAEDPEKDESTDEKEPDVVDG